jgi:hypothetical protein
MLPEEMQQQVNDFVDSLKIKKASDLPTKKVIKAGLAKGMIEMSNDFDDPLIDFDEYLK